MLRQFRQDARDYPATMAIAGLWVLVFVLMVANRWTTGSRLSIGEFILGLRGGHRFGDLTLHELFRGEVWRTVTATFVHYGLLHLGLNLVALYQLGCLVESWYGSGLFLGIYTLTAGLGNLLSGLCRSALGWDRFISSAGGSVVVMGLVGLCAVVGWRARTRLGNYLLRLMLLALALTAGLGAVLALCGLPTLVDNWGHGCGALVGALIGLADPLLVRASATSARGAGWAAAVVLAACAVAQAADDRAETRDRREAVLQARRRWEEGERRLLRLEEIHALYRTVTLPRVVVRGAIVPRVPRAAGVPAGASLAADDAGNPDRELYDAVLAASLRALDSMRDALDAGAGAEDFRRARGLLDGALRDPPALEELREFDARMIELKRRVRMDVDAARALVLTQAAAR